MDVVWVTNYHGYDIQPGISWGGIPSSIFSPSFVVYADPPRGRQHLLYILYFCIKRSHPQIHGLSNVLIPFQVVSLIHLNSRKSSTPSTLPRPHCHKTFGVFSRKFSTKIFHSENGGVENILNLDNILRHKYVQTSKIHSSPILRL
jgi:hypothetical protein